MLIKRSSVVILTLSLLAISPAWGAYPANTSQIGNAGDAGVGLEFGQPMGATAKYWISNIFALDAAAGYHFDGNFDAHADYLVHFYPNLNVTGGRLPFYIGMGGRVLAGDDTQFGFRWPVGASYLLASNPIELFAEIAPVMKLNGIDLDLDGAVGIRIYLGYLHSKK